MDVQLSFGPVRESASDKTGEGNREGDLSAQDLTAEDPQLAQELERISEEQNLLQQSIKQFIGQYPVPIQKRFRDISDSLSPPHQADYRNEKSPFTQNKAQQ